MYENIIKGNQIVDTLNTKGACQLYIGSCRVNMRQGVT